MVVEQFLVKFVVKAASVLRYRVGKNRQTLKGLFHLT